MIRPVNEGICCDREAGIDGDYGVSLLVPLFGIEHAIERRSARIHSNHRRRAPAPWEDLGD
jgi:hypothetical protein